MGYGEGEDVPGGISKEVVIDCFLNFRNGFLELFGLPIGLDGLFVLEKGGSKCGIGLSVGDLFD